MGPLMLVSTASPQPLSSLSGRPPPAGPTQTATPDLHQNKSESLNPRPGKSEVQSRLVIVINL